MRLCLIQRGNACTSTSSQPASFAAFSTRRRSLTRYNRVQTPSPRASASDDAHQPSDSAAPAFEGAAPPVKPRRFASSWDAKESGGGRSAEADYLYELGASSDINLNIDTGQNSQNLDSLFTGSFLGHQSDLADGTLRNYEVRQLANIVGDYYVAPRFLEKVAVHVAKNFLLEQGAFDAQTQVPLVLGIWGGKGQGKSFQTELCFKKLGWVTL
jgi:hypothetical protein